MEKSEVALKRAQEEASAVNDRRLPVAITSSFASSWCTVNILKVGDDNKILWRQWIDIEEHKFGKQAMLACHSSASLKICIASAFFATDKAIFLGNIWMYVMSTSIHRRCVGKYYHFLYRTWHLVIPAVLQMWLWSLIAEVKPLWKFSTWILFKDI